MKFHCIFDAAMETTETSEITWNFTASSEKSDIASFLFPW